MTGYQYFLLFILKRKALLWIINDKNWLKVYPWVKNERNMDIFSSLFALLVTVTENLSKHNKLFASENNGVPMKI